MQVDFSSKLKIKELQDQQPHHDSHSGLFSNMFGAVREFKEGSDKEENNSISNPEGNNFPIEGPRSNALRHAVFIIMRDLKKKLAGMGIEKKWGPVDQESTATGVSKKVNQGAGSSRKSVKGISHLNKRFISGKEGLLQSAFHGETKVGPNGEKLGLSRFQGTENKQKPGAGKRTAGLHEGKSAKAFGRHGAESRPHVTLASDNLAGQVPSESTLFIGTEKKNTTAFQGQKHPHQGLRDGSHNLNGVSGKDRNTDSTLLSKNLTRLKYDTEEGEKGNPRLLKDDISEGRPSTAKQDTLRTALKERGRMISEPKVYGEKSHADHNHRVPGSRTAGGRQVSLSDQVVVKDHQKPVMVESRVSTQEVLSGADVLQRKKDPLPGRGKNSKQTLSQDKQSVHKNHRSSSGGTFSSGEEEHLPQSAEASKSQRVREHSRGLLNQQFSKDDIILPTPGRKPLNKRHLSIDTPADLRLEFSSTQGAGSSERSVDLFGNEQRTLLVKKVFEAISSTIKKAPREILLKLEPESLGKLKIKVSVERDQISTRIMAEHQKVVTLFKGCHGDLQQHLKEQGFQLGSFDVSQDHSAGQDFSGSSTGQESFQGSGEGSEQGSSGKPMSPQEEIVPPSSPGRITDRGVNVTV